jgi:hypothetical protein
MQVLTSPLLATFHGASASVVREDLLTQDT